MRKTKELNFLCMCLGFTMLCRAEMAYWGFNTVSNRVWDGSGHGLDGTIVGWNPGLDDGTSGYSTDIPGSPVTDGITSWPNTYSYRFAKGLGDILLTNNLHLLNLTNTPVRVTIEAFFKLQSFGLPMRFLHLINTSHSPLPTTISPFLSSFDPAPLPALSILSNNSTNYLTTFATGVSSSPVAVGHWHHIAFVIDDTNFSFYLDYQLIRKDSNPWFVPGPFTGFDLAGIGCIPGEAYNDWDGWLDEIRITGAALSPTQFMRAGKGPLPAIRSFSKDSTNGYLTAVTQSGLVYEVQGLANMETVPQSWQSVGVFTGAAFYTTFTNALGSNAFFRVIRRVPLGGPTSVRDRR